ncbi:calcium-dependent phosphotriesterase [Aureobasidium subglaciale]|nr:calcium-dependent phosphotriesterase [Aureobasidium subglaciale]KAI5231657.1 calcium-dependent phosphotriesterase [Aureobasidium subglaciale]KAI5234491.1 calcium-dependent phosphotriesterase [Aureobasidium subglaciale]KAI5240082.1 calcium-dependent phosphotriesterase [Aureobasidium subglaciale]KAI5268035.1 calcium-dependent phosphotriesterase [Aureobasidium subglaciale]
MRIHADYRQELTPSEKALEGQQDLASSSSPTIIVYDKAFCEIVGLSPSLDCVMEAELPFAHEAGVYFPDQDSLFVTSNRCKIQEIDDDAIMIHKLVRERDGKWTKSKIDADIPMANGGVNYLNGVLFCAQGHHSTKGGLVLMDARPPYRVQTLVNSYHGRRFNSLNDVVIKSDGSVWFTDPVYGSEQGFCPKPQLPNQLYRFEPDTGNIRAVADGFGRPNGLCFSPDEQTLYVTDTDWVHGDGTIDDTRASTIYAFDVIQRSGADFLANRRVFAMADTGIPDGIKCDTVGNVFSGCGDGLNVWSAGGTLIGKILVPGGVANFCFGRSGELFLLNETKFWVAKIASSIRGALLEGMGIGCDESKQK